MRVVYSKKRVQGKLGLGKSNLLGKRRSPRPKSQLSTGPGEESSMRRSRYQGNPGDAGAVFAAW